MSYAKKTWALDDPITDVALNNIESGVDAAHDALDATGTPAGLSATTTNAIGTATAKAKADHTHQVLANGTPSTQAIGDAALVGTSAALARADHKHAMPSFGGGATNVVSGNTMRCGRVAVAKRWFTPINVSFGMTFPTTPEVVATPLWGSEVDAVLRVQSITTTGFAVVPYSADPSANNVDIGFTWIAMVNP